MLYKIKVMFLAYITFLVFLVPSNELTSRQKSHFRHLLLFTFNRGQKRVKLPEIFVPRMERKLYLRKLLEIGLSGSNTIRSTSTTVPISEDRSR